MAKNKLSIMTPVVPLNYINVVAPNGNFDPTNPDYNVTWKMEPKEARAFIAQIEELMPEFKGKVPSKRDDEDNYIFKAKQKKYIKWVDKKTNEAKQMEVKPRVINKDNTPYEGREPWGGSTGEVAIELRQSRTPQGKAMLALTLKGVRIHELYLGDGGSDAADGDDDPLFGSNIVQSTGTPVMAADEFEDDVPFN